MNDDVGMVGVRQWYAANGGRGCCAGEVTASTKKIRGVKGNHEQMIRRAQGTKGQEECVLDHGDKEGVPTTLAHPQQRH